MTLTGFSMNTEVIAEDYKSSGSIRFFKNIAREQRIHIMFGTVLNGDVKPYNTMLSITKSGRVAARYSKLHSFSYAGEHLHYQQGSEAVAAGIERKKIGLTICYDLRFPELYSILAKRCRAIVNIANWPQERAEHWRTLLRARAIENQIYMIGVNRTGTDGNGIRYRKNSMVVSPQGEILSPETSEGDIDIYTVDLAAVDTYRHAFPVLKDRRADLYKRNL
jgi:omega-amidase